MNVTEAMPAPVATFIVLKKMRRETLQQTTSIIIKKTGNYNAFIEYKVFNKSIIVSIDDKSKGYAHISSWYRP